MFHLEETRSGYTDQLLLFFTTTSSFAKGKLTKRRLNFVDQFQISIILLTQDPLLISLTTHIRRHTSLNLVLVNGLFPSSSRSYLTQSVHKAAATTLNSSSVSRKSFAGRSISLLAPCGFGDFVKWARRTGRLNS